MTLTIIGIIDEHNSNSSSWIKPPLTSLGRTCQTSVWNKTRNKPEIMQSPSTDGELTKILIIQQWSSGRRIRDIEESSRRGHNNKTKSRKFEILIFLVDDSRSLSMTDCVRFSFSRFFRPLKVSPSSRAFAILSWSILNWCIPAVVTVDLSWTRSRISRSLDSLIDDNLLRLHFMQWISLDFLCTREASRRFSISTPSFLEFQSRVKIQNARERSEQIAILFRL